MYADIESAVKAKLDCIPVKPESGEQIPYGIFTWKKRNRELIQAVHSADGLKMLNEIKKNKNKTTK